jgi:hypothetical protein
MCRSGGEGREGSGEDGVDWGLREIVVPGKHGY